MKNKRLGITNIIFIILVIFGLSIILYPIIVNHLNEKKSNNLIKEYNKKIKEIKTDTLIKEAEEYNDDLYSSISIGTYSEKKEELYERYLKLLDIKNDGMIGYIKIPRLDIEVPIYHGTNEDTLQKGVGHMENSSLPVGGNNTHSIISGHRGLATNKLFTDLDQLKEKDMFYIYVSNEILAYKVDNIQVVEPSKLDELEIVEGKDYVTLVTCTPYAVNTHRLLVRGKRVKLNEKELKDIEIDTKIGIGDIILYISALVAFLVLIYVFIKVKRINKLYKK